MFDAEGEIEERWEISGKAWFIFVKNKVAFVGLSGRNGYGELRIGSSAKYIELDTGHFPMIEIAEKFWLEIFDFALN